MKNVIMKTANKTAAKAAAMKAALTKKDMGGKEIIIELGLTVIAVALIVVFRTSIKSLVDSIMTSATTTITGLFNFS